MVDDRHHPGVYGCRYLCGTNRGTEVESLDRDARLERLDWARTAVEDGKKDNQQTNGRGWRGRCLRHHQPGSEASQWGAVIEALAGALAYRESAALRQRCDL